MSPYSLTNWRFDRFDILMAATRLISYFKGRFLEEKKLPVAVSSLLHFFNCIDALHAGVKIY